MFTSFAMPVLAKRPSGRLTLKEVLLLFSGNLQWVQVGVDDLIMLSNCTLLELPDTDALAAGPA